MTNLSKTAAIKASANTASISGTGTSWQIYGPYRVTEPKGPSTTQNADSYAKAKRIATQWRSEVALVLMGCWDTEAAAAVDMAAHDHYTSKTVDAFIAAGLKAFGTGATDAEIAEAAQGYWDSLS